MSAAQPVCNFGWAAPDFDLVGTDGKRYHRDSVRGDNGLLVMFICNHCPYVKAVLDKLVRDTGELRHQGIGSVAICSNDAADYPEDSFDNMKVLATRMRFPFPYLWDDTQSVAKAYGAICTPDFFGFNAALELQYRGRLDDAGRASQARRAARALRGDAAGSTYRPRAGAADTEHRLLDQVAHSVTSRQACDKFTQRIEHDVRRFGHHAVAAFRNCHDPLARQRILQRSCVLRRDHQVALAEYQHHRTMDRLRGGEPVGVAVAGCQIGMQHARAASVPASAAQRWSSRCRAAGCRRDGWSRRRSSPVISSYAR